MKTVDRNHPPRNSILTIRPYRFGGIWVFDDDVFGLYREAFVGDINKMIDAMLDTSDLPASEQFTALFSDNPFPGFQMQLKWLREEHGGNWYRHIWPANKCDVEGWLCPVLCMFFAEPPKNIYVRAEP